MTEGLRTTFTVPSRDNGAVTEAGQIVVLNGAPRSGKSSIVRAIQSTFEAPWVNLGVDTRGSRRPSATNRASGSVRR